MYESNRARLASIPGTRSVVQGRGLRNFTTNVTCAPNRSWLEFETNVFNCFIVKRHIIAKTPLYCKNATLLQKRHFIAKTSLYCKTPLYCKNATLLQKHHFIAKTPLYCKTPLHPHSFTLWRAVYSRLSPGRRFKMIFLNIVNRKRERKEK